MVPDKPENFEHDFVRFGSKAFGGVRSLAIR
jgi:hypothetical protein